MNTIRNLATWTITLLLAIVISGIAVTAAVNHLADDPSRLKQKLSQSDFYSAAGKLARQNFVQQRASYFGTLPVGAAQAQAAVDQAVPDSWLAGQGSALVNAVYAWLRGQSSTPNFQVDLSPLRPRLLAAATLYTEQYLSTLPVCGPQPTQLSGAQSTLPSCLPPGQSASMLARTTVNTLAAAPGFAQLPRFTANDLKTPSGQPLVHQLSYLPRIYARMRQAPFVLTVAAAVMATVLLLWRRLRRGASYVGIACLVAAGMMGALSWAAIWLGSRLTDTALSSIPGAMRPAVLNVIRSYGSDLSYLLLLAALGTLVLGLALVLGARYRPRRHLPPQPSEATTAGD